MKTNQTQLIVIAVFIGFITLLGLSNCGQQKTNDVDSKEDLTNQQATMPVATPDSSQITAAISTPVDNTRIGAVETKKESIEPIATKEKEIVKKTPPLVPPVAVVKSNPPVQEPAAQIKTEPKDEPAVVKKTEPSTPEPEVKPAETPEPAPVSTKSPAKEDWPVPAKYKSMISPYAANKENLALGKTLYTKHCKSCHGTKGAGDGTKAATIDTKMRSFQSPEFQAQKPGEIYYKTIIGRDDMPSFQKKLTDEEERWAIVQYVMTLKN